MPLGATDGGAVPKNPADVLNRSVNFALQPEIVNGAETLQSATAAVAASSPAGLSDLALGACTVSGTQAVFQVSGGTDATDYEILVLGTYASGRKRGLTYEERVRA